MNEYCLNWLKNELPVLEKEQVITPETSKKISDYYETKRKQELAALQLANEKQKARSQQAIHKLPQIISIIAGFLIAAGVISLIAFNWNKISREVKTGAAFVIAAVPALIYFLNSRFNKKSGTVLKESLAVIWSLLAGGTIEFICQIYKIPVNQEIVLLTWLVANIFILYATDSLGVFGISCILLICNVLTAQLISNTNAVFFYPIILALLPFTKRNKVTLYTLGATAIFTLGFALEKSVPGLWILCYFSAAVLVLYAGIKKDKLELVVSAAAGLLILTIMVCFPDFWEDIGWNYFRTGSGYNKIAAIFDYIVCFALTASAIALPAADLIKSKKLKLEHSFALIPVAILAFYIICASDSFIDPYEYSTHYIYIILTVFAVIFGLFYSKPWYYLYLLAVFWTGFAIYWELSYLFAAFTLILFTALICEYRRVKFGTSYHRIIKISLSVLSGIFLFLSFGTPSYAFRINAGITFEHISSLIVLGFIFAGALIFLGVSLKQKLAADKRFLAEIAVIFVSAIVYLILKTIGIENTDALNHVYMIIYLLFGIYSFIMWNKFNSAYLLPVLFFAFIMAVECNFLTLYFFMTILCFAIYNTYGVGKEISKYFFMGISLISLFFENGFSNHQGINLINTTAGTELFISFSYLAVFAVISIVLPLIKCKKEKTLPEIGISFITAVITIITAILLLLNGKSDSALRTLQITERVLFMAGVFIFALQEIIGCFKKISIKEMNIYTVYFFLAIFIRFFVVPTSLIVRGVVFILFGITILALNIKFSKRLEKMKNTSEITKEAQ